MFADPRRGVLWLPVEPWKMILAVTLIFFRARLVLAKDRQVT